MTRQQVSFCATEIAFPQVVVNHQSLSDRQQVAAIFEQRFRRRTARGLTEFSRPGSRLHLLIEAFTRFDKMQNRLRIPETHLFTTEVSLTISTVKRRKKIIGQCSIGLLVYT